MTRRHCPLYPVLAAALGALTLSACGPDAEEGQQQQLLQQQTDAGQPRPVDFLGGAPLPETLPGDAGVVP